MQRYIAILSVVLFAAKLLAWYLTHSVSILTDALESIVNVITGFIGLYSVSLAAKPRDANHPYGHGKVEFVSAATEGALIILAGLIIIYEAISQLFLHRVLQQLNLGLLLTASTGLVNFFVGIYAIKQGKKNKSLTVEAAGSHIKVDAYSTFAILAGLVLLRFTHWEWLDSAVALVFAVIIIVTGYKVLRRSLAGIMDEADEQLLGEVVSLLQEQRRDEWIDLHNLRVIQYGDVLHVDAHMTLPYYFEVRQAEKEIHALEKLIRDHFGHSVELFIHVDGCSPYQCKLCSVKNCQVRQQPFEQHVQWTLSNVMTDLKHGKIAVAVNE